MTEITKITCDGCGKDLTYTSNCEDYYLFLSFSSKDQWYAKDGLRGGFVTDMAIRPDIDRRHDFCDLRCLDHWSDRRKHRNKLMRDWWGQWKATHGTKHGESYSYQSPPDELYNHCKADIEAAALLEFPLAKPK